MAKQLIVSVSVASALLIGSSIAIAQGQSRQRLPDQVGSTSQHIATQQRRKRAINRAILDSSSINNLRLREKNTSNGTFMEWTCKSSTDECFERANNLQANGCSCSSESGGYRCECPEG